MGRRVPVQMAMQPGADGVPMQSVERIVNGYAKIAPKGKQQTPIYGTPGLVLWCSGLNGAIRGRLVMKGTPYVVAGTKLYSINSAGTETELGDIPGSDLVDMAGDGTNVVVVAGGEIYVWNGSTLAAVTDPDAPSASSVEWIDGYFAFSETDAESYFISALDDPTAYDALDFASAEWKPDNLRKILAVRRTGYMLGVDTIEAIQNVGAADFPFARYEDVFIDVGVIGRDAAVSTNDALYFLASDKTVRRLDGLTATPISDDAVKDIIDGWSDASLTVASAHIWENRLMIGFRNPDGAIFYDQSTERWHERRSYGSETTLYRHMMTAYGHVLCCSASEGKIYRYSKTAYDEDGETLPFEMVTPFIYPAGPFSLDEVEVVAQVGVGSLTLDPQISLEVTEDGETYSPRQYCSLGAVGERKAEVVFGPQGSFTAAALKFTITDAVQRAILGVFAEVDPDL